MSLRSPHNALGKPKLRHLRQPPSAEVTRLGWRTACGKYVSWASHSPNPIPWVHGQLGSIYFSYVTCDACKQAYEAEKVAIDVQNAFVVKPGAEP